MVGEIDRLGEAGWVRRVRRHCQSSGRLIGGCVAEANFALTRQPQQQLQVGRKLVEVLLEPAIVATAIASAQDEEQQSGGCRLVLISNPRPVMTTARQVLSKPRP